jgi:hypothetical protein
MRSRNVRLSVIDSTQWKRKRIDAESARQKLHQAKLLAMKGELISRAHVTKQMTFLANLAAPAFAGDPCAALARC